MGRVLIDFEPWLQDEMLVRREATPQRFADMTRHGFHIYVIEDEKGPVGVATYLTLDFVNVVIGDTFWIRPELRGGKELLNQLIKDVIKVSGKKLMVSQAIPRLLDAKGYLTIPLERHNDMIYTHEGMFVYAPE